jgi:hypothetical protein
VGERTEDLHAESATALKRHTHAGRFGLRVRFDSPQGCTRYLRALASLLFGASTKVTAELRTGTVRDDLSAEELADRLARCAVNQVRFEIPNGGRTFELAVAASASSDGEVALHTCFASGQLTSPLWLQADADVPTPIAALAPQTTNDGLAFEAAHALAGLALRSGSFKEAELNGEQQISWRPHYQGNGGIYPTYECNWLRRDGLATKSCLSVRTEVLDAAVTEEALKAQGAAAGRTRAGTGRAG